MLLGVRTYLKLAVVEDIRTLIANEDPEFQEVIRNIHRLEEKMEGRSPLADDPLAPTAKV